MRKSDGTYTYFVPDVAYHVTKWKRGFKRRSMCREADHHQHRHTRAGRPSGARLGVAEKYRSTCCIRW